MSTDNRYCFAPFWNTDPFVVVAPSLAEAREATWTEDGSRVEDITLGVAPTVLWAETAEDGVPIDPVTGEVLP